jgi:hypothetical protein
MGGDCASERVPITLAEGRPEDPRPSRAMGRTHHPRLECQPTQSYFHVYLEAIRRESSAEWDCRHRAMAAQVYLEIMPDDLFPIPSPRVDQPDNQGPEGNTP